MKNWNNLKVGDIYIDDTPSDFSDALSFETDEEYEEWRKKRKREIRAEVEAEKRKQQH